MTDADQENKAAVSTSIRWRLRLLGSLRVEAEESAETALVRFPTQKTAALLAFLALRPQPHSRETLASLFWPEAPTPGHARRSLRMALVHLRQTLKNIPSLSLQAEALLAGRDTVALRSGAFTIDVDAFRALQADAARAAERGDRERERAHLSEAVTLYQESGGPLLPQFYETWVLDEREILAQAHRDATLRLAVLLTQEGQAQEAHTLAQRALSIDPDSPELRRLARDLHLETGRPAAALPFSLVDLEDEEEGLLSYLTDSLPQLANETLDRRRAPGTSRTAIQAATENAIRALPPEMRRALTRFAVFDNRFTAVNAARICREPAAPRLLETLCAARLIVREEEDCFPAGYRLPHTVRRCLQEEAEADGERQQAWDRLAQRQARFCLYLLRQSSRLYHYQGQVGDWPARLRQEAPHLRQALEWALRPRAETDRARVSAARIAVDMASALPAFFHCWCTGDEARAWSEAAILRADAADSGAHLQGVARETAAIFAHRQNDFAAERLHLLKAEALHRISHSTPGRLWRRSSLAHRGTSLINLGRSAFHQGKHDIARQALDDVIPLLRDHLSPGQSHNNREAVEYQARHILLARTLAEKADLLLFLGDPAGAKACLEESQSLLESLEEVPGQMAIQPSGKRMGIAAGQYRLGCFWHYRGEYAQARRLLGESLQVREDSGDELAAIDCQRELAMLHAEQGFLAEARSLLTHCRRVLETAEQRGTYAAVLGSLGDVALWQGNPERASLLYEEGLAFWREQNHDGWIGSFLVRLGEAALVLGNAERAHEYGQTALPHCEASRSPLRRAAALCLLGKAGYARGQIESAVSQLRESLALREAAGHSLGIARSLEALEAVPPPFLPEPDAQEYRERAAEIRRRMGTPPL